MWVITYKGKPSPVEALCTLNGHNTYGDDEGYDYICATTKGRCINTYLYNFGFTWKERPEGVQVQKICEMMITPAVKKGA